MFALKNWLTARSTATPVPCEVVTENFTRLPKRWPTGMESRLGSGDKWHPANGRRSVGQEFDFESLVELC